ncbi:MAG: hypothetical protein M9958_00505 [Chitinophagales bacterium]|nr:hypothetical protein [Chitinophagales bacterium]
MGGVVEFIIKMQDGITSPLQKMSSNSNTANQSLLKLTASNKQLIGMISGTSSSVSTLTGRIEKLKALRDILPSSSEERIKSVNKEISTLNKEMERLQNIGTGGGLKKTLSDAFNSLPEFFKNPLVLAGAGLTSAINSGLKNSTDKLDYQLLLGNDAGQALYKSIKNTAPASMRDSFLQGGKSLVSSGHDPNKTNKMLSQIGDVSLGKEDRFNGLLSAFTNVQKEGKLTEGSLQQLNDAGFKPLVSLNHATGESMDSLQKRFEQGKISILDLEKAFESATGPGGEFEDKLKAIAESPMDKWDLFKTKIFELSSAFGEVLMPVFSKGIDLLNIGFDWLSTGIDWTVNVLSNLATWVDKNSVLVYSLAGAVLGGVVAYKAYQAVSMLVYLWQMRDLVGTSLLATAKGALTVVTSGLTIAQNALSAAFLKSPIGWVVLGLGALAGGVIYAWNKFEGFRKIVFGLWEAFKEVFNSIGRLFKQIFNPIFDAISAIKEGRWMDAAKATGNLLYNLTPVGIAEATYDFTKSGGFNSISEAFGKGAEKGAKSWKEAKNEEESKEDNFETPEAKLLDYLKKSDLSKNNKENKTTTNEGLNAVSGGGTKNISIVIHKMLDNTSIIVQNGTQQLGRDIQRVVEESLIRAVASGSGR